MQVTIIKYMHMLSPALRNEKMFMVFRTELRILEWIYKVGSCGVSSCVVLAGFKSVLAF